MFVTIDHDSVIFERVEPEECLIAGSLIDRIEGFGSIDIILERT